MPIAPNMVRNESDVTLGLDRDGNVVEGEANPEMVTLLVVPGGNIGQDVVDKHQLGDRLKVNKPVEPAKSPEEKKEAEEKAKDESPKPAADLVPDFQPPPPSEEGPAPRFVTEPPPAVKGKGK